MRSNTSTIAQGFTEPGSIVDIAEEAGFTISSVELQKNPLELSDEALDSAAGGMYLSGWEFVP